jgi:hypothetical protein
MTNQEPLSEAPTLEFVNSESANAAAAEPPQPKTDPEAENRQADLAIGSALIGAVERALAGSGADFAPLFRAVRLELADDYTFLDPFALDPSTGRFEYSGSLVSVNQELPSSTYVAGISEALRRVVDRVAIGDRARRVRERVGLELALVARKQGPALSQSGFRTQLDRIAGTKVI